MTLATDTFLDSWGPVPFRLVPWSSVWGGFPWQRQVTTPGDNASPSALVRSRGINSDVHPRDTTLKSHEAQLRAYRRLGPAGRASIAARLSEDTRELARGGIRARHPDYTEEEVDRALRRLWLGDELFGRAWPAHPLLAP
jgi:hypothetical protein